MTINKLLVFIFFIGIALSFPIQVYTSQPNIPAIFYLILFILIINKFIFKREKLFFHHKQTMISWTVYLYALYVVLTSLIIFLISGGIIEFISTIYTFVVPVLVFWYFINFATTNEYRLVIIAVSFVGLAIGVFMVIENYFKLGRGYIFEYSFLAYDYISYRAGGFGGEITGAIGRINNVKSFGPLEHASISAAWLAFSYFGVTALIGLNSVLKKYTVLLFYIIAIALTLNFQTIIAFMFIILIFETFRVIKSVNLNGLLIRILLFVILLTVCFLVYLNVEPVQVDHSKNRIGLIAESLRYLYTRQIGGFLLGFTEPTSIVVREYDNVFELLILQLNNYLDFYSERKILIFTGTGFGKYSFGSGSDTGIYYTISSLGVLMSLLIFLSLIGIIILSTYKILKEEYIQVKINTKKIYDTNMVKFAICIILFSMITELHYSIWYNKGILPLIFFSLSIIHISIIKRKKLEIRKNEEYN